MVSSGVNALGERIAGKSSWPAKRPDFLSRSRVATHVEDVGAVAEAGARHLPLPGRRAPPPETSEAGGAERDKPPSRMAGLLGIPRIDADDRISAPARMPGQRAD